jgi:hypothetical protein
MKSAIVVCSLLLAIAASARAEDAADARHAEAVRLGHEGSEAYRADHFAEALRSFEAAYRLMPAAPLVLNISRAELKLGRCADALRYAEQYRAAVGEQVGASPDAPDEWLETVRRTCIESEITSAPTGATIWIDGERQTAPETTPWTGRLPVGHHKVLLWKSGYDSQEEVLEVTGGAPARLSLALHATGTSAAPGAGTPPAISTPAPLPPPEQQASSGAQGRDVTVPAPRQRAAPRLRWEPFIPAGVAVVGVAMAIAGGVLTRQCPSSVGPDQGVTAAETCQYNRAGFADVGWGVAGTGAVTAGVLWLVLKPPAASAEAPPAAGPAVRVGWSPSGVLLSGRF